MNLPDERGTYALCLSLEGACWLEVGSLGSCYFPAGSYVYVGSAHGPGGLRARLGRHLRGQGKPRWHIDALRSIAQTVGFVYAIQAVEGPASVTPLECSWSQSVSRMPGAIIPASRFGASDCRSGCRAHLVAFPDGLTMELLVEACKGGGIMCSAEQSAPGRNPAVFPSVETARTRRKWD